jgi:positive regulator of sigma E activity
MNWRAFMTYGLASALVLFVVPFIALFVLMLLSGGALRPAAMAVMFPFVLSLMPTLFASFYASYRDIFAATEPADLS